MPRHGVDHLSLFFSLHDRIETEYGIVWLYLQTSYFLILLKSFAITTSSVFCLYADDTPTYCHAVHIVKDSEKSQICFKKSNETYQHFIHIHSMYDSNPLKHLSKMMLCFCGEANNFHSGQRLGKKNTMMTRTSVSSITVNNTVALGDEVPSKLKTKGRWLSDCMSKYPCMRY